MLGTLGLLLYMRRWHTTILYHIVVSIYASASVGLAHGPESIFCGPFVFGDIVRSLRGGVGGKTPRCVVGADLPGPVGSTSACTGQVKAMGKRGFLGMSCRAEIGLLEGATRPITFCHD